MNNAEYHKPVMLDECIEGLNINPEGIYVDVTFGGGGHSAEIVKHLTTGKLYAFDQDPDALVNAKDFPADKFQLIQANFAHLKKFLRLYKVKGIDGLIADLGISSHQIDEVDRGFSFRENATLDMRMGQEGELDAASILNTYSEKELHRIFGAYGEVRNAKTLAQEIIRARAMSDIKTTDQLVDVLSPLAPRGKYNRYYAQVFQALRIEVNKEMDVLVDMLEQSSQVMNEGGRLVVMSYHSLEDRPVKNYIAKGAMSGQVGKDFYGNPLRPFEAVNRKPIVADADENALNNRARSAKLRIAERNGLSWPMK
jgi:16S rRNA (cytosine1402-N4)-methyltransferase